MNRKLHAFLRRRGATDEEIERAEREGHLTLLALDRDVQSGRQRYGAEEAAARAGMDRELSIRLWRALGFPDVPPGIDAFTDDDVKTLVMLRQQLEASTYTPDQAVVVLVQQVRLISSAQARIAELFSEQLAAQLDGAKERGLTDDEIAEFAVDVFGWSRLEPLIAYGLRVQFRAALWRKLALDKAAASGGVELAVGFVDLVGYTALSQELEPDELAILVARFDELAYDTVAKLGGRVVKTIGDEVMFVAADVAAAAQIALQLIEQSALDDVLPDARAGIAYGTMLAQEGDYYGPVVNLASRIVALARPGSVVASEAVHEALEYDIGIEWRKMRSHRIRDIGRVELWSLATVASAVP
ncbi:MAG TPA: adenylate/guanylate cyclase domain-containing protein [Acidimicrobiia bacterium]